MDLVRKIVDYMQGFARVSEVWSYLGQDRLYKETIVFDKSTGDKLYSYSDNLNDSEKRFYSKNLDLVRILE